MSEQEIGRAMVSLFPTAHLVERCKEHLGDLSPEMQVGSVVQLEGVLVVESRRHRESGLCLDVDGIGRFVLKWTGLRLLGITFLPRLYCHDLGGNLAEGALPENESAHEECLTAWYDRLVNCEGDLNLWARIIHSQNDESEAGSDELPASATGGFP
jgi:hypothetical protein